MGPGLGSPSLPGEEAAGHPARPSDGSCKLSPEHRDEKVSSGWRRLTPEVRGVWLLVPESLWGHLVSVHSQRGSLVVSVSP